VQEELAQLTFCELKLQPVRAARASAPASSPAVRRDGVVEDMARA
jgi:hypothetical protein